MKRWNDASGRKYGVPILALCGMVLGVMACESMSSGERGVGALRIAADIEDRLAKFVPTSIEADLSELAEWERQVLTHLIAASDYMDEIFRRQAWEGNPGLSEKLARSKAPRAAAAREYLRLSYGPWDHLDESPFIGSDHRPETAGYYPADLTREEFDAWLEAHPEDEEAFKSLYTVIRRKGPNLVAILYSVEYREWLQPAAAELQKAAALSENESLAEFLRRIAVAFVRDDVDLETLSYLYYEADLAWMDLDSRLEITIGPYETYEDRMFGYKAAFESFVTLVDPEESDKLVRYKAELPAMERNLPIPDEHKNFNRGTESPMRVVDEIYTGGDARSGVQTIAFNLPNDERVREEKGSKKVMLRNVMDAKFRQILQPIAEQILVPEQFGLLSQQQFFNEVLFHELSHGLGPGKITIEGRATEARLELKELYSPSEEAKADVMGIYNLLYLMDRGLISKEEREPLFVTYLAGLFRSTRFGIAEAHGKGTALQFNYLLERGAIRKGATPGTFAVDFETLGDGIRDLVHDLCMLQAEGNYDGTRDLFEKYAVLSPPLEEGIERLKGIPVDLRPMYPAAAGGK